MKSIIIGVILFVCIETILGTRLRLKFRRRKADGADEDIPKIPTVEELDALSKVNLEAWISVRSPSFNPGRYANIKVEDKGERIVEVVEEKDIDPTVTPAVVFEGFRKNIDFGQEGSDVPALDKFYFRLSGNNIYYTKNDKDLVVLGAINVKNVVNVNNQTKTGDMCFKVFDGEKDQWELCTESQEVQVQWFCELKKVLGSPCGEEPKPVVVKETKEEVILYQLPSPYCNQDWDYLHHGKDWDCECKEGMQQSPIDLNPNMTCNPYQVAPWSQFQFKDMYSKEWKLVYEENLVRVECALTDCSGLSFGSIQLVGKEGFEGKSIQFHTPSDHVIGGKRYDLEVQCIYESTGKGGMADEKAVLSMLFMQEPGRTNDFMQALDLTRIPNVVQTDMTFLAKGVDKINLQDMWVSVEDQLKFPTDFSYFYYEGSLTSPQCSQNVNWFIVSQPFLLGNAYIQMLKQALNDLPDLTENSTPDASYINKNADGTYRELQKLNGREVSYHQSCDEEKKKEDGHYEVVESKAEFYYYTAQKKNVGLTGAKVVSFQDMQKVLSPSQ